MILIPLALMLVGATDTGQAAPARQDSLPLKTTRTVAFETSEGTWLSLDVSPDGQTIVFELLGDIYTMPASGGAASRITSGPAFDSQPRYSPDGKRIVFLSDRSGAENVWLMNADGSLPKPLSKGETSLFVSPEWTPDGKYIVASKTDGVLGSAYTMWIWHVDGGSGSKLITDKGEGAPGASRSTTISALGAAFGSDGRYVWFSRHRGGFGYNLQFPEWELAIYDRVEGKVYPQTDTYGSAMRPVVSPDGHWLVYGTRFDAQTGLRLRDLRTGDERWLAWPVVRDDQESRYTRDLMPGSAFTPDSKTLITSWGGKFRRVDIATGKSTDIPFTAQVEQQLGPLVRFENRVDTGAVEVKQIRNPSLSPDGNRLTFSALDRVYVMDYPSGRPRRLTTSNEHEQAPAWSPDGKWIAYMTWSDSGGALKRVNSGGGKPETLTAEPAYFDVPVWSPDGKRIVFIHGPRAPRITERNGPGYDLSGFPPTAAPLPASSPPAAAAAAVQPQPGADLPVRPRRRGWSRCGSTAPTAACT